MLEQEVVKQTRPSTAIKMLANQPTQVLDVCYLQCVHNLRQDIACDIIDTFKEKISPVIIDASILSAVAHQELMLIAHLLQQHPEVITTTTLARSFRMAVVNGDHKLMTLLSKGKRFEQIANGNNDYNPYVMMYAIDQGDVPTIGLLIELPHFHIKQHHITYAQIRHRHDIASLLDMHLHQRNNQEQAYERDILSEVKDNCPIGPHLEVELQRRKRYRYRSLN